MTNTDRTGGPSASGMPMLGLGTWQNDDHDECAESVRTALEMGYRHIDTAQMYKNEEAVGEGIATASVDREEVFLATKIWHDALAPEDVIETTHECLDRLGVDSVDLLYVHWPVGAYDPEETLSAFADLHGEGLIDNVGVSNFSPEQIETAVDVCEVPIFANQVELHPLFPQAEIRETCAVHDIEVVGYAPLSRGRAFDHPAIKSIAEKHDVSEAQICLAWLREKDITAIPKATGEDHLRDNWASLTVELGSEDVEAIDSIEETTRLADPDFAPWN